MKKENNKIRMASMALALIVALTVLPMMATPAEAAATGSKTWWNQPAGTVRRGTCANGDVKYRIKVLSRRANLEVVDLDDSCYVKVSRPGRRGKTSVRIQLSMRYWGDPMLTANYTEGNMVVYNKRWVLQNGQDVWTRGGKVTAYVRSGWARIRAWQNIYVPEPTG